MTLDYWKFPRHSVAAEKFEMRGINTILLHYHYRVYPELGKGVCDFHNIQCAFPACASQLDKYWLPNIPLSSQPRHSHVENCHYNKILEHVNDWIIMDFLDNKAPQVE